MVDMPTVEASATGENGSPAARNMVRRFGVRGGAPRYDRPVSSRNVPVLSPKRSIGTPSICSMVSCRLVIGLASGG